MITLIKDEDLKQAVDYSEGQKTAAYMVLGEIVNLLNEFADNIRIIGGWVPTLLYPESDHIGSIDVDVLLNQMEIKKAESYKTIKRLLVQNGYAKHPEKYFTFVKTVVVQGVKYDVDVDFLSGKYGGDGGNISKPKDAYDIYCTIDNYPGGVKALAIEFAPYIDKEFVQKMKEKLQEKFASVDHAGPADIVSFIGITDEDEIARVKQDAYQKVNYLISKL